MLKLIEACLEGKLPVNIQMICIHFVLLTEDQTNSKSSCALVSYQNANNNKNANKSEKKNFQTTKDVFSRVPYTVFVLFSKREHNFAILMPQFGNTWQECGNCKYISNIRHISSIANISIIQYQYMLGGGVGGGGGEQGSRGIGYR